MTAAAPDDGADAVVEAVALVVAAGRGRRFGPGAPKQYRLLGGRAVLERSLRTFLEHPAIDRVHAVIHRDDRALYDAATAGLDLPEPAFGGPTRQSSVRLGLEALAARPPRRVAIHDAARPLVDADAISRVVAALDSYAGAVAATPVRDTLKRLSGETIVETVPRESLWRARTPQAFRFADILAAHRSVAEADLPDDAAVAERAGLSAVAVECAADNLKISTEEDLAQAERLLPRTVRVGNGFDVHRFAPGDGVTLCGVTIPHDRRLAGHSDADVALHAVADALLGAVAAGDIGARFPSGDPRWAGQDSALFLRCSCEAVAAARGRVLHVDLTLICERPRIAPYRAAMRERLAALLGLPDGAVSVKATTTDGLGFAGRVEGIAAQATATVETAA